MTAAVTILKDQDDADSPKVEINDEEGGYLDCFCDLPPDIAAVGHTGSDPKMLDEALRGSDAKEWQAALEYEINQLEKLGTWVVEDLPHGQTAIPCSEVVKVK